MFDLNTFLAITFSISIIIIYHTPSHTNWISMSIYFVITVLLHVCLKVVFFKDHFERVVCNNVSLQMRFKMISTAFLRETLVNNDTTLNDTKNINYYYVYMME